MKFKEKMEKFLLLLIREVIILAGDRLWFTGPSEGMENVFKIDGLSVAEDRQGFFFFPFIILLFIIIIFNYYSLYLL